MRIIVLVLACLLPASAAAAAEIASGPLTATTTGEPWKLAFTDAGGKPVLTQAPGTGSGPTGTLGFQTALGWFHATKVTSEKQEGSAYSATLATSDPTGR